MNFHFRATTLLLIAVCGGLAACAANRDAEGSPPAAAVEEPPAGEKGRFSGFFKMPEMPKMPKFADMDLPDFIPGRGVKVVDVREKDLRELPSGQERALAYKKERRRGFWIFGGPVDFKEPNLPEPGTGMDGSLLPPRDETETLAN
jgi:hypothetical protein